MLMDGKLMVYNNGNQLMMLKNGKSMLTNIANWKDPP